jgi:hypothetical protein
MPPIFDVGAEVPGIVITFVPSTSPDVHHYEFLLNTSNTVPPTPSGPLDQHFSSPAYFHTFIFVTSYLWYRAMDISGNYSAWACVTGTNATAQFRVVTGTLSVQNATAVNVSGIQTGAVSATGIRQVVARMPFDVVPTLAGGSTEEAFNVSLSNRGFTTQPDGVTGLNVSSDPSLKCRYDWDDASNSSTNAVLKVSAVLGTLLSAGPVRIQGELFQYD